MKHVWFQVFIPPIIIHGQFSQKVSIASRTHAGVVTDIIRTRRTMLLMRIQAAIRTKIGRRDAVNVGPSGMNECCSMCSLQFKT